MNRALGSVMVTGGAGFIGSNFVRYLLSQEQFHGVVVNVDKLTYAGNLLNLQDVQRKYGGDRYFFEQADICARDRIVSIMERYSVDTIVHFAAESHVDRSILGPAQFMQTNVVGTFSLLEAARAVWSNDNGVLFHHVSTDEVYGSLGSEGCFLEDTPYDPRSPYSASKASSDHFVRAYYHSFGLPVTISNCSNNYGPYQFPEKLIPLTVLNMIEGKELPVYGKGENVRDWLYVEDHCTALYTILLESETGETYNIGGDNEQTNIDVVQQLCRTVADVTGNDPDRYLSLIRFVKDRPGHDLRYAINCEKIKRRLAWRQSVSFERGLRLTVEWYLSHLDWVNVVRGGHYHEWISENYRKMGR